MEEVGRSILDMEAEAEAVCRKSSRLVALALLFLMVMQQTILDI
jgi:hypothetical protein